MAEHTLVPVDYDPFASATLHPVEHDPFASAPSAAAPAQQPGGPLRLTVRPQDAMPGMPAMRGAPAGTEGVLQDEQPPMGPMPPIGVSGDPYLEVAERFAGTGGPVVPRPVPATQGATNAQRLVRGTGDIVAPHLTSALAGEPGKPAVDVRDYLTTPPAVDPYADQGGADQRVVHAQPVPRQPGKVPEPEDRAAHVAEDVINLASNALPGPGAAAGVAKALAGKAGVGALMKAIFAGVAAKTADRVALEKAIELEQAGIAPSRIWHQTGWARNKGGDWHFEIPDNNLKVTPPTRTRAGKIEHPELEQAYPGITEIPVSAIHNEDPFSQSRGVRASYGRDPVSGDESIKLSTGAKGHQARMSIAHELQHGVQMREDFPTGASTRSSKIQQLADEDVAALEQHGQKAIDESYARRDKWVEKEIAAGRGDDRTKLAQRYWAEHPAEHERVHALYDMMDSPKSIVRRRAVEDNYRRVSGEVEARNVATRLEYNPTERKVAPPHTTEDIPRDRQLVGRGTDYAGPIPGTKPPPHQGTPGKKPPEGDVEPFAEHEQQSFESYSPPEARQAPPRARGTVADALHEPLGENPKEVALTVNDILDPKVPAQPPRSRDVASIGKQLAMRGERALRKLGVKAGIIEGPGPHDEMLSRIVATEIKQALGRGGRTAHDWYTGKIKEAMGVVSAIHPEIATDPHAKLAFVSALAITSQGEVVPSNVRLAEQVYAHFKEHGRFPTNVKAKEQISMNSGFTKLNALLDEMGPDGARDFLTKQYTVRELEKITGKPITGENKDTLVYGSAIFGPKIGGGFWQNLNGNFSPVTMDLWFMRAWGRITNTLVRGGEDLVQPAQRLRDALAAKRQTVPRTMDQLIKRAEDIVAVHEKDYKVNRALYDSGKRTKSEVTYAAQRLVQNNGGLNQAPSGGGQRNWIRGRIERARELLKQEGIDVTPADLQAIWWYPEKELYAKLGGRDAEGINVDYASALRDLARKQGLGDDEVERAVRAASGRSRSAPGGGDRGRGQGDRGAGARGAGEEEARGAP